MSTVGNQLRNSFSRASKRFSDGVQAETVPRGKNVSPIAKLAKIIIASLIVIAAVSAFDFLIFWITSGKFLQRFPF